MKTLITLIAILTILAANAYACAAFLDDEYVDGRSKVCIYDHLGDAYFTTIPVQRICPQIVTAPH